MNLGLDAPAPLNNNSNNPTQSPLSKTDGINMVTSFKNLAEREDLLSTFQSNIQATKKPGYYAQLVEPPKLKQNVQLYGNHKPS